MNVKIPEWSNTKKVARCRFPQPIRFLDTFSFSTACSFLLRDSFLLASSDFVSHKFMKTFLLSSFSRASFVRRLSQENYTALGCFPDPDDGDRAMEVEHETREEMSAEVKHDLTYDRKCYLSHDQAFIYFCSFF